MVTELFKDFDLSDFWDDGPYALQEYVDAPPTDELIQSVEQELEYKLPASYITLMKRHNGGIPYNNCFPVNEATSWAVDHVAINGIFSIGRNKTYSLCGSLGSQFMIEEWGYPEIGICICNCPSAGHDIIMLDYRKCGRAGEPEVVHVDQERDFKITFLAKDFETFIRGLVSEDAFDTSEEDLQNTLEILKTGKFSDVMQAFFAKEKNINFDKALRNLLTKLTVEKGYFALHADDLSCLLYDIQFYLFTKNRNVRSKQAYLKSYPQMIAFGNNEIATGGYAEDFVSDWFDKRVLNKQIVKSYFSGFSFSKQFEQKVLEVVKSYAYEEV
ncbi:MAG TPA: SMI1/KNR4 family protein [Flavisolibacter sp.]|nr:SMI1/KNR4 family protein [Flavisolibacter sp.]